MQYRVRHFLHLQPPLHGNILLIYKRFYDISGCPVNICRRVLIPINPSLSLYIIDSL